MLKQVSLSVNDEGPFNELAVKHDSKISVVECKNLDSRGMVLLLEIHGPDDSGLMTDIQRVDGVKHVNWARNGAKGMLVMVTMETPLFCEIAKCSGALCRSCPLNSSGGEGGTWRLLIRDVSTLRRCIEMLERNNLLAQVSEVSDAIRRDILTPRQREIVQEAVRQGYFDLPRKTDLTELARKLSVKPATLSEILRRAQGKMAKYYLESNAAA